MLQLGVNIDHVATVRQARYRGFDYGEPDPVEAARQALAAGAHGITAHLREDRRHIIDRDVKRLREVTTTRFNFELANEPEIIAIALDIRPDIVCLVPEKREEVTTEGGLDVVGHLESLRQTTKRLTGSGIEVSLFIDPDPRQIEAAAKTGAPFIELHTGAFAEQFHADGRAEQALETLAASARLAHQLGIRVNAGHGLNYENLRTLHAVPHLEELNIGHSIVSRAVFTGLQRAVKDMLDLMTGYPR
ncbi:MAG TPA: pyridoxine 5'-phosphate synthase [Verrucomicrobiae bacterium]|nr:pyridoxine 5'-phosphate synthase [Verrucomicrobiae bacterium]